MPTNIIANIRALIADANLLVRQEVELAKAEAGEKAEQMQTGLIAILGGLLIAMVALLVLVQALVVALSNVMPASIAALIVGAILAVIALVSVQTGASYLQPKNLKPTRTIRSIKHDVETMTRTGA